MRTEAQIGEFFSIAKPKNIIKERLFDGINKENIDSEAYERMMLSEKKIKEDLLLQKHPVFHDDLKVQNISLKDAFFRPIGEVLYSPKMHAVLSIALGISGEVLRVMIDNKEIPTLFRIAAIVGVVISASNTILRYKKS